MDHAHRGDTALSSSDYTSAIEHFTLALQSSPEAATYYIKRSTAYQRTSKSDLALTDAEKAVVLATKRAKRELIATAQLRRGIALFQLGRYGDAKFCLQKAKERNDKEKSVDIWIAKCDGKLKSLSEEDEAARVTVSETPSVEIDKPKVEPKKPETTATNDSTTATAPATAIAAPSQTPKEKIRHDWYQSTSTITITILAKGVPKDAAAVDIQPTSLSVSFPLQTGSTFDFSLDPLFANIDPTESKHRILSTKIEITLQKATPGQKWAALEATETDGGAKEEAGPAYPTSAKGGPKNWDKVAQSYQKPAPKPSKKSEEDSEDETGGEQKKDEKKEEDDMYIDDEFEDGDPANAFFKKLYAGADPDTRRAMMKSYQESGGTALSTDWGEVSKKRVEISPPDGMEAKKWEY